MANVLAVGRNVAGCSSVEWDALTPDLIRDARAIILDLRTLPRVYVPGPRWSAFVWADRLGVPIAAVVARPPSGERVYDVLPYHIRSVARAGGSVEVVGTSPIHVGYAAFLRGHELIVTADSYVPEIATRGGEMVSGWTGNRIAVFHPPLPEFEDAAFAHVARHVVPERSIELRGLPAWLSRWAMGLPSVAALAHRRDRARESGQADALIETEAQLSARLRWVELLALGDEALRRQVGAALRVLGTRPLSEPAGLLGPDWRIEGSPPTVGVVAGSRGRTARDTIDRLARWAEGGTGVVIGHTSGAVDLHSLDSTAARAFLDDDAIERAISRGLVVLPTHAVAGWLVRLLDDEPSVPRGRALVELLAGSRGSVVS